MVDVKNVLFAYMYNVHVSCIVLKQEHLLSVGAEIRIQSKLLKLINLRSLMTSEVEGYEMESYEDHVHKN